MTRGLSFYFCDHRFVPKDVALSIESHSMPPTFEEIERPRPLVLPLGVPSGEPDNTELYATRTLNERSFLALKLKKEAASRSGAGAARALAPAWRWPGAAARQRNGRRTTRDGAVWAASRLWAPPGPRPAPAESADCLGPARPRQSRASESADCLPPATRAGVGLGPGRHCRAKTYPGAPAKLVSFGSYYSSK